MDDLIARARRLAALYSPNTSGPPTRNVHDTILALCDEVERLQQSSLAVLLREQIDRAVPAQESPAE